VGPILGLALFAVVLLVAHHVRPKYLPLHAAFSTTAFGLLFLVAGSIGYTIKKSNWSFISGTWSDGVVWWEIVYGVIALVFAAYFWRKGLETTA
jgi:uncharacterized membrane protein (UPF0136 family)